MLSVQALLRGKALLLLAVVPLALTWLVWRTAADSAYGRGMAEFESLTVESELALLNRLNSYEGALLGGAGFSRHKRHGLGATR